MKEETMERFIGLMTEVRELKEKEPLIAYGRFDDNVYVLKEGIVRAVYFDGAKEATFAFALPGTLMLSYYSFYNGQPSYCQLDACCDSVALKISKEKFLGLIESSTDFAQWMLWMSLSQLWFHERKLEVLNGDAKERFESLVRNRPDGLNKVSSRVVASYIGITPQYLSKLKRQFLLPPERI
jgi:CRP-like cAMP-binding protein